MWIRILGSAAGGGFPQWNCDCPNCRGARDGSFPCLRRTQSSIAVSADYRHWFLFNAAPDISSQIDASPALWPQGNVRHTPIQGIVLSDAELDHTLGLLSLRLRQQQRFQQQQARRQAAQPLPSPLPPAPVLAWQKTGRTEAQYRWGQQTFSLRMLQQAGGEIE